MYKKLTIIIVLVSLITGAYLFLDHSSKVIPKDGFNTVNNQETAKRQNYEFPNPKKSAHYESNTPEHATIAPAVPINVVINFNFDLSPKSEIKILKDGKDFGVGETKVDTNKLSMLRDTDPQSGDGTYKVEYNACWPDGSCHDGYFYFAIDTKAKADFKDMSDKVLTGINLEANSFNPIKIIISKGTKITWVNKDKVIHYVNTDSHPAHTYFPQQNSKALNINDTFSLVFAKPGWYPYHCSAHESIMKGEIIVLP